MVHHSSHVELAPVTDPGSPLGLADHGPNTAPHQSTMEDLQHAAERCDIIVTPVAEDYDVTEKCLSWRKSCAETESLDTSMSQHPTSLVSIEPLDNREFLDSGISVDNAYCLPMAHEHITSEHIIIDVNQNMPAMGFDQNGDSSELSSSQEEDGSQGCESLTTEILDNALHCRSEVSTSAGCSSSPAARSLPRAVPARLRRDSEESMDTISSQASGPQAGSYCSAFTDTLSSINSAENLIREVSSDDEHVDSVSDIPYDSSSCCMSFSDALSEKMVGEEHSVVDAAPVVCATSKYESFMATVTEEEPFATYIEEVDPDFAANPPVVTDNLIIVEDESFLNHSQHSLFEVEDGALVSPCLITKASTLPDLRAYHRYLEDYELGWAYQDARVFLSDDILFRSQSSLTSADIWDMEEGFKQNYELPRGEEGERRPPPAVGWLGVDSEGNPIKVVPSSDHTIIMVLLSVCVGILFVAMGAIRNLQTSLHPHDGLGVTSLALVFAGYTLGSLISSPVVRHFQPRSCLIVCIVPNILYLLVNVSSSLWLLDPVSLLQGLSMAILWSVVSTYVTFLAQGRAISKGESIDTVCCRFFNIFSLIYQGSLLLGNLAASILLMFGNSMHNADFSSSSFFSSPIETSSLSSEQDTINVKSHPSPNQSVAGIVSLSSESAKSMQVLDMCGSSFHGHGQVVDAGSPWTHPNDGTIYMLHGTFIGFALVALGIAIFGVEPLNKSLFNPSRKQQEGKSSTAHIKGSLQAMARSCVDVKFLLLVPLLMYSVMQFGFVSAEVTAAYITCPMGIDQVGFGMVLFALGGFPTSFFCGFLTKKCGRLPLITLAASINLISLIILAQWKPGPGDLFIIHPIMFFWGISDGIWISQANGLISAVFKSRYESTYTCMRVAQGLGVTILLSFSTLADMRFKIFFMMAACLLAVVGYLLMKLRISCENRWAQQRQVYHIYRSRDGEDV